MLQISMFSSSPDLRRGLGRTHALLTRAARPREGACWTRIVGERVQHPSGDDLGKLDLQAWRERFLGEGCWDLVLEGARRLGCELPDASLVERGFADALISAKALALHGGRDVYGASNKWLWDHLVTPAIEAARRQFGSVVLDPDQEDPVFEDAVRHRLRTLMSFDTSPAGQAHDDCSRWLAGQLGALGFSVTIHHGQGGEKPILLARREASGCQGHVVLYGHYDVTAAKAEDWSVPPHELTEQDGRWFGCGVGDDRGPLACRLAALESIGPMPALTWLIQGEEETGSPHARRVFPELMRDLRPTIWLEETGYHDHGDCTLRLIGQLVGAPPRSPEEDPAFAQLLIGLRCVADAWEIDTRLEVRGLNKQFVDGGCPFNANLPAGARYVALGVNDSRSRIHGRDESIPRWTMPLHRAELRLLFDWVDRTEGGR
jgi:hypothetical protein